MTFTPVVVLIALSLSLSPPICLTSLSKGPTPLSSPDVHVSSTHEHIMNHYPMFTMAKTSHYKPKAFLTIIETTLVKEALANS